MLDGFVCELFGIGGAQSVRGFEERELGGDMGAQASVEYLTPAAPGTWFAAPAAGPQPLDLRAVVFADAGWVRNLQGNPCLSGKAECRMGSLGIGARLQWQQMQVRLDVARAMTTGSSTAKGDVKAHFGLNYNF